MSYSPDHHLPTTPHLQQHQSSPPCSGPNILLTPPIPSTLSPSRAAPSPPSHSPRRARDRHIAMKEPAKVGLFTVDEEGGAGGTWKETFLALKTDLGRGVAGDDPFGSDADSTPMDLDIEVRTPVEPPFPQIPTLGSSSSMSISTRPRRLAPLDLNIITHSLPFHSSPSTLTPTPKGKGKRKQGLMGAAPILSPEEYSANREFDLGAVLDDLLNTCGERFPTPPPRSPVPDSPLPTFSLSSEIVGDSARVEGPSFRTPPKSKSTTGSPPPAPGPKKQKRPQLKGLGLGLGIGEHYFLSSLSRENSPISPNPSSPASRSISSSTSGSSPSSKSGSSAGSTVKRLPPRAGLPSHWTDNVI